MGENETPDQRRRRENLIALLASRFGGRKADLARLTGLSEAYIWQIINGRRPIGERLAARLEPALGLESGGLSVLHVANAPLTEAVEMLPRAAQDELQSFVEYLTTKHAPTLGPDLTHEVLALLQKSRRQRQNH